MSMDEQKQEQSVPQLASPRDLYRLAGVSPILMQCMKTWEEGTFSYEEMLLQATCMLATELAMKDQTGVKLATADEMPKRKDN